jgi:hypothetical protein
MAHELVHSCVWGNYMNDMRWKEMALFEDIYADELLTEIISQKVCIHTQIGGRKRIDYSWAIRYGFITTFQKMSDIIGLEIPENLKREWWIDRRTQPGGMKSFRVETKERLVSWSRSYFRKVQRGRTNAMEARRKITELTPSLSDYLGKELYFR